jgi:polyisoprenoid-binding protein YceI
VPAAGEATVRLEGTLDIHGGEHPVTLPVELQATGDRLRATTTFVIPYVSWGMKNPGNAMLNVADTVEVRIETSGRLD